MSLNTQTTSYTDTQLQGNVLRDTVATFKSVQLHKDQTLGIGSYGKVCKAKCDDLICAAKVMHETLFDPSTSLVVGLKKEHRLPIKRFERECEFLSTLRHPNIIQYLGVCTDPDTGLPMLLMELMDYSLTHLLESSPQPLPFHIQVNLCHDITLALSFLHSNSITHRDLSGNNVLLIGHVRAKVTDFGMARLGELSSKMTQLTYTMCPGTDAYMPPEAVKEEPEYSEKIDCFSFGVIIVQMLTQQFPKPGNRRKEVEINHPSLPSGTFEVRVSEIERRQNHIGRINPNHLLLLIALDCLKDKDVERPTSQDLCERVAILKEDPLYSDSIRYTPEQITAENREPKVPTGDMGNRQVHAAEVEHLQRVVYLQNTQLNEKEQCIQRKDHIISGTEQENRQLRQQCEELQQRIGQYQEEILSNQSEFHRLDAFIHGKDELIKEQEIRMKEQMDVSENVIAQFEERVHELERQLTRLEGDRQTEAQVQSQTENRPTESRVVEDDGSNIKLRWTEGPKAPYRMSSHYGVAIDGSAVYFKPGGREVYECRAGKFWTQLPNCPISNCPLVVINKLLTLVGGSHQEVYSNQLLSLTGEGSLACKTWTEELPPMPTKRSNSTAVCVGTTLIVAGGQGKGVTVMSTVEVMNTWTHQWSTAASLPEPMWAASATVCGDRVYMLGGWDNNCSVFVCSLSDLLHSCKLTKSSTLTRHRFKLGLRDSKGVWKRLPTMPVTWCACVSINNQLLLIGGLNLNNQPIKDVHVYNPLNNSWEIVSYMSTARRQCFAAVLPDDQVMVVGGVTDDGNSTDIVEIATIVT